MFIVFGMSDSGNCYKVRPARRSSSRVPSLQLGDGSFLPESNAILHYLAEGSLAAYPAFGRWLERVKSQPRHQPMQ